MFQICNKLYLPLCMQNQKIMNNIPLIIKELRLKNNFSQEQLAQFLDCKRELICYYENSEREVSVEVLEKLADLFGIELEDFFELEVSQIKTSIAFAFRASAMSESDLQELANFRKIVKNYNKILQLERDDD